MTIPDYQQQPSSSGSGLAIASLVLGLVSLVLWLCPLAGLPSTIVGLILGIKGLKSPSRGMAMAGVVLCSICLVLTIGNAAWGAYLGATGQHPLFRH